MGLVPRNSLIEENYLPLKIVYCQLFQFLDMDELLRIRRANSCWLHAVSLALFHRETYTKSDQSYLLQSIVYQGSKIQR